MDHQVRRCDQMRNVAAGSGKNDPVRNAVFFSDRLVFFDFAASGNQQKEVGPCLCCQRFYGAIDSLDAELCRHLDQQDRLLRDVESFPDQPTDRRNILRSATGGVNSGRKNCKSFILRVIE